MDGENKLEYDGLQYTNTLVLVELSLESKMIEGQTREVAKRFWRTRRRRGSCNLIPGFADHVGDHVVLSPEGAVLVTSPGMEASIPPPPPSIQHQKLQNCLEFKKAIFQVIALRLDRTDHNHHQSNIEYRIFRGVLITLIRHSNRHGSQYQKLNIPRFVAIAIHQREGGAPRAASEKVENARTFTRFWVLRYFAC